MKDNPEVFTEKEEEGRDKMKNLIRALGAAEWKGLLPRGHAKHCLRRPQGFYDRYGRFIPRVRNTDYIPFRGREMR